MTKLSLRLLLATSLLVSAGAAHAVPTFYGYKRADLPVSGEAPAQNGSTPLYVSSAGGHVSAIDTLYNPREETFSWEYTVTTENDGFWLVVSDGDNPKGDENEYAILYGDIDNDRLSAYVYNGANNAKSYKNPGVLLQTFDNVFTVSPGASGGAAPTKTVSFEIEVAGLNLDDSRIPGPKDWDGIAFGPSFGVWFHPTSGSEFTYDDQDKITKFTASGRGYLDGGGFAAREVPEPGILYLTGLGLCALSLSRRRSERKRKV